MTSPCHVSIEGLHLGGHGRPARWHILALFDSSRHGSVFCPGLLRYPYHGHMITAMPTITGFLDFFAPDWRGSADWNIAVEWRAFGAANE